MEYWTSDLSGEKHPETETRIETYCGNYASLEELENGDYDFRFSEIDQAFYHIDDCGFCEDIEDYCHIDDCIYIEDEGMYIHTDNANYCEECGLSYNVDRHDSCPNEDCESNNRGCGWEYINGYHHAPSPDNLNNGQSVFSIGFEIEKRFFINDEGQRVEDCGEYVGGCQMFSGYETDSSCGVEAISHILPLVSKRNQWRKEFIKMLDEAKHVIEDSPSSHQCGGHITLSCSLPEFQEGKELLAKLKFNLAIFYALYRGRLSNSYCKDNKLMKYDYNTKYSPVKIMRNRIEIRLPSAVTSRKQLLNRYDLCFKVLQYSILKPCSWTIFKNHIRPNIVSMYRDGESRAPKILELADQFRDYLITEEINPMIEEFIN